MFYNEKTITFVVDVVFRFTHIVVDHVTSTTSTHVTPVIFVTSLEGHVFKYVQLTTDGGTSCLVEVLALGCDGHGGRTTARTILLDNKQVHYTTVQNDRETVFHISIICPFCSQLYDLFPFPKSYFYSLHSNFHTREYIM